METPPKTFWQLYKDYRKRVWSRALSDTWAVLGINKTTALLVATTILSWMALWLLFKWKWDQLSGEITPALTMVMATIAIGFLILLVKLKAAPVLIDREQQKVIELTKALNFTLTQSAGYRDNIANSYETSDLRLVLIKHLVLTNNQDKNESLSLQLWCPQKRGGVFLSPQTASQLTPEQIKALRLDEDKDEEPFLKRVENISPRSSLLGKLLFKMEKLPLSNIPNPLLTIVVTSQLNGAERAFNVNPFTHVTKPYPRTIEELNQHLAST
jgi:hypothetical protein